MLSKKKKIVIIATMLILLVVTGYLNIVLNGTGETITTSGSTITTQSFFSTYRTDRESTRNSEIAHYDAIIASETSSAEAKATAETKRLNLIESMETELVTEGLIKAQGFEDVIVTNGTNKVNVVVKCADLTKTMAAQIASIVSEQTGLKYDNIDIIPVQ